MRCCAFGLTAEALVASFFCVVLVVLSAIDIEHRIVPNRIVLPAAAVVLVAQTILHPSPEWALARLGASGFLLLAALVYPRAWGWATSSWRSCSARCSGARSPSRS